MIKQIVYELLPDFSYVKLVWTAVKLSMTILCAYVFVLRIINDIFIECFLFHAKESKYLPA